MTKWVTFTAAKGGAGATVTACAYALIQPDDSDVVLISSDGPAALGLMEPSEGESVIVNDHLRLYTEVTPDSLRAGRAADRVIIDMPTGSEPFMFPEGFECDDGVIQYLVTRSCYLSLRKAVAMPHTFDGTIVVMEPGRALRAQDISYAVHAPVVAEIEYDPAVARAVDAGLLAARLPRSLRAALTQQGAIA